MILLLAKQAIERKLFLKSKTITGNYEFYYACGILARYYNKDFDNLQDPVQLQKDVASMPDPEKEDEKHLHLMISIYHPDDKYTEQMSELYHMGKNS